jgi:dihydroorotase
MVTYMIKTGLMDWMSVIDRLSTAPARIAGIDGGCLSVGSPADITIIDPDAQWLVDPAQFQSRCVSTPLSGLTLDAAVRTTIVAGRVRYQRPSA